MKKFFLSVPCGKYRLTIDLEALKTCSVQAHMTCQTKFSNCTFIAWMCLKLTKRN